MVIKFKLNPKIKFKIKKLLYHKSIMQEKIYACIIIQKNFRKYSAKKKYLQIKEKIFNYLQKNNF
jgi:hypothetical protein